MTSAPLTRFPYLKKAMPFLRTILLPPARRNVSLAIVLMPGLTRIFAGTTEYTAPESTRNSRISVRFGLAGLATSIGKTVIPTHYLRLDLSANWPRWDGRISLLNLYR